MMGLMNLLLTLGLFLAVILALLLVSPVQRAMLREILFHPFVPSRIEVDDSRVTVFRGEAQETPPQYPAATGPTVEEALRAR
jgi:hypothetical protein